MELRYIELKTGWNDNGPAWIGFVKESRSGKMVYFNDHAFQKDPYQGKGWYFDVETGESYWISGVKKDGTDRHWAAKGFNRTQIERSAVQEYLSVTSEAALDTSRLEVVDLPVCYPIERIQKNLNQKQKD